jgi:hypothetical protein
MRTTVVLMQIYMYCTTYCDSWSILLPTEQSKISWQHTIELRSPKPEIEAGKRGRGEGGRSPRQGRGEDGKVRVEGEVGEDGDLLLLRGGGRSPTAAAPPQTTAAAPPQMAPPQACAARRSGGEGEGGGAEASAAARVRAGKRSARMGEKKGRGTILPLSPGYAWRIPPRCATDMLCVAHNIGVRHACFCIVQKWPNCHLDNNLDIAQWFWVPLAIWGGARFEPWTSHLFLFL